MNLRALLTEAAVELKARAAARLETAERANILELFKSSELLPPVRFIAAFVVVRKRKLRRRAEAFGSAVGGAAGLVATEHMMLRRADTDM